MNEVAHAGDDGVLVALIALHDNEARVARAEAALAEAKKRHALSELRLGRLRRAQADAAPSSGPRAVATLGARIVGVLEARRGEVLTPAGIAAAVGATRPGSVRQTLQVLTRKGQVEKMGVGRYRARAGRG